jgi:phosphate transport system substrate-binding protein
MQLLRVVTLVIFSFILTACPGGKQASNNAAASASHSSHKIVIRGSNTIGEELAPRLMADFKNQNPAVDFEIEAKATGYGIAALRAGQCDIAAASRPVIAEEKELAQEANLEMNDTVLGAYSVAVVVHPNNPVANLTKDQVREIFTGKVQNWKEVGGSDTPIVLYIRDPISGTHLGFKEIAMNNEAYAAHPKLFTNYTALATAVATDPSGIGYSGIEMAKATGAKLISIDGTEASDATVHSGKYPYARMLRFYTNKARESQATKDFIAFTLSARGQELIRQMGFTPKP